MFTDEDGGMVTETSSVTILNVDPNLEPLDNVEIDEDDVYEEIETERTSVELRNNPVIEKNTSNIVDSPENTQTTPLFEEINLTTIKQATLDDLYYVKGNIESSSDNSTFWIVLILLALLLFIGWELS